MPHLYDIHIIIVLIINERILPMNRTFTPDLNFTDDLLRNAMRNEHEFSPSEFSLSFIKNFARNFRVYGGIDGRAQELVLN